MISIVVPTYNEADNLRELVERVFAALRGHGIEGQLIVVDDSSPDGTGELAERLAREYPIKIVHRPAKRGLASAVLEGTRVADGDIIGVMDADLSHDPAVIPELVRAIRERGAELAVASRYVPGGGVRDWPLVRRLVSWAANLIARPFTRVRDVTSGFFLFRRSVLDGVTLDPAGFKIGVEVITKGRYTRWEEVPYRFTDRATGASKLGSGEVLDYLLQVGRLAALRVRGDRPANLSLWPIVGAFVAIQLGIVLFAANGPFVDEGIYTVGGLRVLEGKAAGDGYWSWFNGSPYLWPVLAALGHRLAGLAGARLAAVALSVVTLAAFAAAARALVGRAAAWWGTVAFAANGCFMSLAHLAVYDGLALAALAASLWLGTRWARTGRRRWLVAASVALALAAIAKYAYALMAFPLAAILLAVRPAGARRREVAAFLALAGALAAIYFTAVFGRPWTTTPSVYFSQTFPTTRSARAAGHLYLAAVPLLLAACGAVAAWRTRSKALVAACLGSLLIWPLFHVATLNHVSETKHVVAGFLFAYALAGVGLERLWRSRARWAMAAVLPLVVLWGTLQSQWQEYSWADVRPVAGYLLGHMKPGETVVANSAWSYALYLYPARLIAAPGGVGEAGSAQGRRSIESCTVPWLVSQGDPTGPLEESVARCGYRRVLTSAATNYFLDLRLAHPWPSSYTKTLTLYRLPERKDPSGRTSAAHGAS